MTLLRPMVRSTLAGVAGLASAALLSGCGSDEGSPRPAGDLNAVPAGRRDH